MKKKLSRISELRLAVMADGKFKEHIQAIGVDISGYPTAQRHVPELGITYTETYYPNHMRAYFHTWLNEVYYPEVFDLKKK